MSYVAVDSMCLREEVKSGSFYANILNHDPLSFEKSCFLERSQWLFVFLFLVAGACSCQAMRVL